MKTRSWLKILFINLAAGILSISPFLPGPPNPVVNLLYNGAQILGLLGLTLVPVGLVWTIREVLRTRASSIHQIDVKPVILVTLPLTLFITSIYLSGPIRDLSRGFAIERAGELIQSIEEYKLKKGEYPVSLEDLTPRFISKIPSSMIMGINGYRYGREGGGYIVSFEQNVLMSFNFEVVMFDPMDHHRAEGELTELHDTGRRYWKYYVFD